MMQTSLPLSHCSHGWSNQLTLMTSFVGVGNREYNFCASDGCSVSTFHLCSQFPQAHSSPPRVFSFDHDWQWCDHCDSSSRIFLSARVVSESHLYHDNKRCLRVCLRVWYCEERECMNEWMNEWMYVWMWMNHHHHHLRTGRLPTLLERTTTRNGSHRRNVRHASLDRTPIDPHGRTLFLLNLEQQDLSKSLAREKQLERTSLFAT